MTDTTTYRPRFALLDDGGCERIHRASLEILRRTGVLILEDEARGLVLDAGGIPGDEGVVTIPPALVEWALVEPPSSITLCLRGTTRPAFELAGREVAFGTGSDGVYFIDPRSGRRLFTSDDIAASVRLCDALPQISFTMSMGIPSDIPPHDQSVHQYGIMLENTEKPTVFVAATKADCEVILSLAAAAAGGADRLRMNPTVLLYSEPTTPLVHSRTATEKLLYMADQALPIVHSPAPMMGGTAPVTLAGGLAIGNAEVLSSLVIHQLKRRGSPFVYGTGLHHLDMRTAISVYGGPEFQLARAAVAEMGRYYGLPTWGYAACTDSLIMDEQAAADAAYQVRDALLTGTNLVHDVGYVEAGLATSPELIVLTAELIEMHRRFDAGITISSETLAVDVIDTIGPGGDFLRHKHTRAHFRDAWFPGLYERRRFDEWNASGAKSLGQRVKDKTIALLEEHEPPPLPEPVAREIAKLRNH
jgi:trimethylamine--corrinoid protein Co-methyltransferase